MRTIICSVKLAILAMLVCLAGCSAGNAESDRKVPQTEAAKTACDKGDLLSCEFPSFDDLKEACKYLERQLAGRQVGDWKIEELDDCAAPVQGPASEVGTAAVAAHLTLVKGPPSHGAFLLTRVDKGWRLTDTLLAPAWTHGGSCDSRFQLRWDGKQGASDAVLDTLSERICRMPLDAKEQAAGVSNVASTECRHTRYGLARKTLTRLSSETSSKACTIG